MNAFLKGIGFGVGAVAALVGSVAIAAYFIDLPEVVKTEGDATGDTATQSEPASDTTAE